MQWTKEPVCWLKGTASTELCQILPNSGRYFRNTDPALSVLNFSSKSINLAFVSHCSGFNCWQPQTDVLVFVYFHGPLKASTAVGSQIWLMDVLISDSEWHRPYFSSEMHVFSHVNISEIRMCLPVNDVTQEWMETSLVVQWLWIHLPVQGTRVWSLLWEDSICRRATKPVHYNFWAGSLEPVSRSHWTHVPQSPCSTTREVCTPELERSPSSPQLEKAPAQQQKPKINKKE